MKKHFKNGFRYFKVTLFRPKHFGPLKQHPCSHLSENAEDAQNLLKKVEEEEEDCKKTTKTCLVLFLVVVKFATTPTIFERVGRNRTLPEITADENFVLYVL